MSTSSVVGLQECSCRGVPLLVGSFKKSCEDVKTPTVLHWVKESYNGWRPESIFLYGVECHPLNSPNEAWHHMNS